MSYRRRRPFHPDRLQAWLEDVPDSVVRAKGLVWIAGRKKQAYTMSLVGNSTRIEVTGQWIASLPAAQQQAMRRRQSETAWHPDHGDREQRLAVLGTDVDFEQLEATLDDCLVTDAEWNGTLEDCKTAYPKTEDSVLTIGEPTQPYI